MPRPASPASFPVASPWRFIGGFALLTLVLCVGASGLGGRALWCDEILRITGQRMSVAQLLRFEHLRVFCTQTPAAYLFMRPWQALLGMETGGFVLSALCGAAVTACALWTAQRLLGGRPHPVAALAVASNPLLVYYGSELAFYSLWTAAAALALALLVAREDATDAGKGPWNWKRHVPLAVAGTAFVAFHFAGLFVWAGVAGAALLVAFRAGGVRLVLRRAPALVLPALLNLPMYLGASNAPEHIGTKALQGSRLASLPGALARYAVEILPSLTGGRWVGVALLLAGAVVLWHRGPVQRRALFLAAAMTGSIVLFMAYSHLRDYLPNVARYWTYALSPALTVVAVGLHGLLSPGPGARPRRWSQGLGGLAALAVLAGNSVATGALWSEEGRPQPYKRLQRHLETLPPARQVVSANHYENRFLGGYYPIPAGGQLLAPCLWEEGRDARIRGLRALWELVPDAVAYAVDPDRAAEFREAGALRADAVGLQTEWPRLLRWAWRLGVYPEPSPSPPVAPGLFHAPRAALAAAADAAARPAVVPGAGWPVVQFRDPQGTMRFALLAPEGAAAVVLDLYLPPALAGTDRTWRLELAAAAYRPTRLDVSVGGRRHEGPAPRLGATLARSLYLPQRQTFDGMPKPEHLQAAGMQFAVECQPEAVRVSLGALPPGWTSVALSAVQKTPWLLLSHGCVPDLALALGGTIGDHGAP